MILFSVSEHIFLFVSVSSSEAEEVAHNELHTRKNTPLFGKLFNLSLTATALSQKIFCLIRLYK